MRGKKSTKKTQTSRGTGRDRGRSENRHHRRDRSSGRSRGGSRGGNSDFVNVTKLFESRKNRDVFVGTAKEQYLDKVIDKLTSIRDNDAGAMFIVNLAGKWGPNLSVVEAEDRDGGRGRSRGRGRDRDDEDEDEDEEEEEDEDFDDGDDERGEPRF